MQITAKLLRVFPQIERGTFTSRKIWLEVEPDQYPQTIEVEVSQAKVNLFNNIPIGSQVTVDCNFRGKVTVWKDAEKCFWSLSVWKVTAEGARPAQQAAPAANTTHDAGSGYAPNQTVPGGDVIDDLPFRAPRNKPSMP